MRARLGALLFILALAALLLSFPAWSRAAVELDGGPVHREEMRGLWVVRDALNSPESVQEVLSLVGELGINALFVQVNGRAEAYYRSSLVPRAPGLPDGFDPLQTIIDGVRPLGIQVHAWINAFTASMLDSRPRAPNHVLVRHPDWVLYHRSGRSLWDYGAAVAQLNVPAIMLDPGLVEVQDYVVSVVQELAQSYELDGIHLDYIRYPGRDFGYHPRARARFQEAVGIDPLWLEGEQGELLRASWGDDAFARVEEAWAEWRRRQVTSVVRRIYRWVSEHRPHMVVSAAVFANIDTARNQVLQDWPAWLEEGIVDAVVLMAYSPDADLVGRQVEEAVRRSGTRHVYAGLGIWRLGDNLPLLRSIVNRVRRTGAEGMVLFSYNALREDQDMIAFLRERLFQDKAQVPRMAWKVESP